MRSTVSEIERYAAARGIDLSGARNKAERLAAIASALRKGQDR